MKASTRKRLEALEQAASMHGIHQLVMLDVRTFSDVDREAYWAGDEGGIASIWCTGSGRGAVGTDPHHRN
jgi:hypothetical protein